MSTGQPWNAQEGADARRGDAHAAFMARLTAGATHDLRNVLAVVKESAGLVEDLMAAAKGGPPDREKVSWALDRIRRQVARGAELATALNRVMHGLDRAEERVPLHEALHNITLLAQRFARLNNRSIALDEVADELAVTCNALELYLGITTTLQWCVEQVPEGGTVLVRAEPGDDGPVLRIEGEPAAESPFSAGPAALADTLTNLPVTIEAGDGEPALLLRFR